MEKYFPVGPIIPNELKGIVKEKNYSSGSILFRPEDPAEKFYYILSGRLQIFFLMENSWVHTIRFYKSGDMMGDLELFYPDSHDCFSRTVTDAVCLEIPMDKLRIYLNGHTELLWEMGRSIAEKLKKNGMIQAARMRYPLRTRLAAYFLMMDQLQEQDKVFQELHADSYIELAALLGCSYRHLSRTMGDMERTGLIQKGRNKLVLIDKGRLEELAGEMN